MMKKTAYSMLGSGTQGRTLADLYFEIRRDAGLPDFQKSKIISDIQDMTAGLPVSTPLSSLLRTGLGSVIGWLISKYFGMGAVGQVVSSLMGGAFGSASGRNPNKPMFLSNYVW